MGLLLDLFENLRKTNTDVKSNKPEKRDYTFDEKVFFDKKVDVDLKLKSKKRKENNKEKSLNDERE